MAQVYSPEIKNKTVCPTKPFTVTQKIAEGKTKVIWGAPDGNVLIESKARLTKENGAVSVSWDEKAELANQTACNVFRYLLAYSKDNPARIPKVHFIRQTGKESFMAKETRMYPLEVVARRIATGSYLKRYPHVKEGTVLDDLVIEFFYKDDAAGDPQVHPKFGGYDLFDPKKPMCPEAYLGEISEDVFMPDEEELRIIALSQRAVFEALECAWAAQGVELIDLKCEYGLHESQLTLADVIDNDSWRIRFKEDGLLKDKEIFRQMGDKVTENELATLKANYEWVAEATSRFPGNWRAR